MKPKAKNQQKKKGGAARLYQAPSAVSSNRVTQGARFQNGPNGSIIVRHREYITPIHSAVNFTLESFAVNTGVEQTFPWLSHIAHNYETYTFRRLAFDYAPCCPTSKDGAVMFYMDMDAADLAPLDRAGFMQNARATVGAPWIRHLVEVPSADLLRHGMKFVRGHGNLAANLDIKTYDIGCLHVAAEGSSAVTVVGDLFVDYEVEFRTPQYNVRLESERAESTVVGPSQLNPFGTSFTTVGALPIERVAAATMKLPDKGEYLLETVQSGTVFTANPPTFIDPAGLATVTLLNWVVTAAATSGIATWKVKTVQPNTLLNASWAAACTTLASLVIRLVPYSYN